jgi:toxin FitB
MIILDTNVISEPVRPEPNQLAISWLNQNPVASQFLTTPTVAELSMGANKAFLKTGSKRFADHLAGLKEIFVGRILAFDLTSAEIYGQVVTKRTRAGRPIQTMDAMIAAICIAHGATLATRNVRDFEGLDLKLVNPFEAGA